MYCGVQKTDLYLGSSCPDLCHWMFELEMVCGQMIGTCDGGDLRYSHGAEIGLKQYLQDALENDCAGRDCFPADDEYFVSRLLSQPEWRHRWTCLLALSYMCALDSVPLCIPRKIIFQEINSAHCLKLETKKTS